MRLPEVISKLLEFNEITTSNASHSPRNDRELLCHPELALTHD